ncbi:Mur18B [Drosophila busckii]|uniref:Mur18B n=1 Tax=Drosophila busckii TaxID=30019 RepID=A0A0M4EP82_DROBS|nr:uncharacterized protein LOC108606636 [Drosophila busckii]ALC50008.1 Mur18B [Drosophila busckii]
MTVQTTMMTTRRSKCSTATSLLLLCAALLMTKSCGILAFSGDGATQLSEGQQAAALMEMTTLGEGSGWDLSSSTNEPEFTTEREELTTTGIEDVDTTTKSEEIETTASPNVPEPETTTAKADEPEAETTASPSEPEPETTASPNEPEPDTTASPSEPEPETTASPSQPEPETTTSPNEPEQPASTIAPTPPPVPVFECQAAGLFPHISGDCQRYYNCLNNPFLGQLQQLEMMCAPQLFFSPTSGRCMRDLSECPSDEYVCSTPGRFAGHDDTYYYNCVVSSMGGFHKYVVRCSTGQRFEPMLGGCWRYDWTLVGPGYENFESSDLAAIKRELKQFKAEDKLRKKAEKNQEKLARKQQKLEEKMAKKAAKDAAKKAAKENKPKSAESAESAQELASSEN